MKSLDLADTLPYENESTTVDFLLGNDYYLDIVLMLRTEVQYGLYFLSSKLAAIPMGRTSECALNENYTSMLIFTFGMNLSKTSVFTSADKT